MVVICCYVCCSRQLEGFSWIFWVAAPHPRPPRVHWSPHPPGPRDGGTVPIWGWATPLGGVHGGSLAGFDFGGIFRVIDVWICLDMFGIILQDAQVIDIARFWDVLVGITLQHQQSKQNQVFLP